MFDPEPRSPNDGISSSPRGNCSNTQEWSCSTITDTAFCEDPEQCLTIYTCEPYDDPEYEGANDFVAAGGGEGGEEPV